MLLSADEDNGSNADDSPVRTAPSRRAAAILVVVCLSLAIVGAATASPAHPTGQRVALSSLEQGVLADLNAIRVQHHLVPLRLSTALTTSAREHSQEMASKGYFAHESADGSPFWKRIKLAYPQSSAGYWSVGENLLWSSPGVDPSGALTMWMKSPEHRANILSPSWREIGISALHADAAPGAFQGLDVTIVTTDFGVRR
jgi:uncharacterized protein YkwD